MTDRLFAAFLRWTGALLGVAGLLVLAGCGGGSGAPNNPYEPPPPPIPPLLVLPSAITVYPGTPTTLTVSGGVAPYRAFSTDATALPVSTNVVGETIVLAANPVNAMTGVQVTVEDARGVTSTPVAVTVQPAPLLPSLITITGNPNPACSGTEATVCSGGTGTARVQVTGAGGVGIKGRQVRFDAVQGNFQLVSTNPAQPLVTTFTTTTDANGNAVAILSVPADTPTQSGILRATDVTSGQQITGAFLIQQMTTDGAVLAVLPLGTTTITGPDSATCSTGVTVAYFIFGGTPPYRVTTGFPQAINIGGAPVTRSGGSFTATTNGTCFENLTFVITDATGATIPTGNYPFITNERGATPPTPPLTPLVVTPGAIAKANCVPANTFQFLGTGGVAPYSAVVTSSTSPTSPILSPQTGLASGQAVTVSGLTSPSQTTITLFDSASPRQSGSVTIDCSGSVPPPPPSALVVTPPSFNYAGGTCVGQTSAFKVTGGTPPYTAFVTSGQTGAVITPTSIAAAGGSFAVTGLTNTIATTNVTVMDSGSPILQQVVSVSCPALAGLTVQPLSFTYSANPPPPPAPPAPTCATAVSNFVIQGGTPPYTVAFSVPGTAGTINPTTVTNSGAGFSVTNLANVPKVNQITITDSNTSQAATSVVSITCTP
ncbi:MAG: hypothetical protein IT522_14955 [Burkholderiales bacterium]|nr:hypothetical protein [Burkholderiales bacterium]